MHTLLEMAQIGSFSGYKVCIYGGEGPIPHLHFKDSERKISGCIRLDRPEYFIHNNHRSKLNSKEKTKFIQWINSNETPFKKFAENLTVYQYAVILWNENNENYKMEEIPIPDYSQLPTKN